MLRTERLILREFTERDVSAAFVYNADPQVLQYRGMEPHTSEDETREEVERIVGWQHDEPRRHYVLAIVRQDDSHLIGWCMLRITHDVCREGEIGYTLARCYWGAGYATEAARAMLGFGFGELHLHRIFGACQAANGASARVLAKLGMRQEAHLWESEWTKGQWRDIVIYALLDHEWAAQVRDPH